jgi:hypothetical protein
MLSHESTKVDVKSSMINNNNNSIKNATLFDVENRDVVSFFQDFEYYNEILDSTNDINENLHLS